MATIKYHYRSTRPHAFLTLRLYTKSSMLEGKTNVRVSKLFWEKEQFKPKKSVEEKEVLLKIETTLLNLENHILTLVNEDTVTKQWLERAIKNYYEPEELLNVPTNLVDFIDYYIIHKGASKSAQSRHNVLKKKLIKMELSRRQILIKDVNDRFKVEFEKFLQANQYGVNTIQKDFAIIKTLCKYAEFSGLEISPQLKYLSLDSNETDTIYLTLEELDSIEKLTNLSDNLEVTRDWLIISCFTAQRVSDFMRFTKEMVKPDGKYFLLEFTQKKTEKKMSISVNPKIIAILKKRDGNFPPPLIPQKYNDYLKTLCCEAGINQLIEGSKVENIGTVENPIWRKVKKLYKKYDLVSSHIGRRSFATNFYGKKMPLYMIMNCTGHTSEKTLLTYLGETSQDIAKATHKHWK